MPTFFVTAPPDAASDLARVLVEERFAACVNIVDCESVYWWEDEVVEEPESILFVKTTEEKAKGTSECIEEHHPYDVPCIERFDEDSVLFSFARWREDAVS